LLWRLKNGQHGSAPLRMLGIKARYHRLLCEHRPNRAPGKAGPKGVNHAMSHEIRYVRPAGAETRPERGTAPTGRSLATAAATAGDAWPRPERAGGGTAGSQPMTIPVPRSCSPEAQRSSRKKSRRGEAASGGCDDLGTRKESQEPGRPTFSLGKNGNTGSRQESPTRNLSADARVAAESKEQAAPVEVGERKGRPELFAEGTRMESGGPRRSVDVGNGCCTRTRPSKGGPVSM